MMINKIAIYGAGGFGREAKWVLDDINKYCLQWDFIGHFDDDFSAVTKVDSKFFLGGMDTLNQWEEPIFIIIAVGNPIVKRSIIQKIKNQHIQFATLIHPLAIIGPTEVHIGEGSVICAGNIITTDVQIGRHVLLHSGCTVGHDAVIGDYCSFMPSVNISGEVNIGEAVYAGTGAKIINRIDIGNETIIGAGAVVIRSLPSRCTAVGVPAKSIK